MVTEAIRSKNGMIKISVSEEDKLTVARARKIQRFLSQPFFVATQFTGYEGRYVPINETIQGFKEILTIYTKILYNIELKNHL